MKQDAAPPAADSDAVSTVTDRRALFALPGLVLAGGALLCATLTLFILLGVTPIDPTTRVVITSVVVNSFFVLALIALIGREVARLLKARTRGRAAARLHIRIVVLFSIVAITPAILVAIFASITLNAGLDRWFALRTQSIVSSSRNIGQAYMMENASYLQGQTISMANDLERNRELYNLDRTGFGELMTRQARGRGLLGAFLVESDGTVIVQADIKTEKPLPAIPQDALQKAAAGQPTLIPPGVTNLVGAIIKLEQIPSAFLYTVRAVDPKVMGAMRMMEENATEYRSMEAGRAPLPIAFAVLYIGFVLIALLAAVWAAFAVADRVLPPLPLLTPPAPARAHRT
ncbi:PAS domain-containing sensor histidine kinase, partial [Rhizobium sp. SEMIA 4085]|nr:PAS domain-containing sensor histidine kinase [Rhizobium sp. SEMIA 4085]